MHRFWAAISLFSLTEGHRITVANDGNFGHLFNVVKLVAISEISAICDG
jgi:hypothetical protein